MVRYWPLDGRSECPRTHHRFLEITFTLQSFEQWTPFTEESGPSQLYRGPGDLGTIPAMKEQ